MINLDIGQNLKYKDSSASVRFKDLGWLDERNVYFCPNPLWQAMPILAGFSRILYTLAIK